MRFARWVGSRAVGSGALASLVVLPALAGRALATEPPVAGASASSTPAQPRAALALELGFRVGYSLPFGSIAGASDTQTGEEDLSTVFSGRLPLMGEVGLRLPHFYLGAVGTFAPLFPSGSLAACSGVNARCSGNALGLGADFKYYVLPEALFNPWLGLGLGYEWDTLSIGQSGPVNGSVLSTDFTFSGVEFVALQVGLDVATTSPAGGVGPFLMLGVGQFSSASSSNALPNESSDIPNKAFHEWFTLGARGVLDIALVRRP